MERISYAACEETTRKRGSDVVQYLGKNYKINCIVPTREEIEKILSFGQKIVKIKIEGETITIIEFEEQRRSL